MLAPAVLCLAAAVAQLEPVDLNALLELRGEKGGAWLEERLRLDPGDDNALALSGTAEAGRGVEQFLRFLRERRFCLHESLINLAFGPNNGQFGGAAPPPAPPVTYDQWRQARLDLLAALTKADATLARVNGPVDVRLTLTPQAVQDLRGLSELCRIYLIAASSRADTAAAFSWQLAMNKAFEQPPAGGPNVLQFDRADVEWLRSYLNLAIAGLELSLAYDGRDCWNGAAHILFRNPTGVPENLKATPSPAVDLAAAIHLADFPVRDANRLQNARQRLLLALDRSRAVWDEIEREVAVPPAPDPDAAAPFLEWIPGPGQSSIFPWTVNAERIAAWREVLNEVEALLKGDKLLPFWRTLADDADPGRRGLNLERFFENPRRCDLIDWLNGTAAIPDLEVGEVTTLAFWLEMHAKFEGDLLIDALFMF